MAWVRKDFVSGSLAVNLTASGGGSTTMQSEGLRDLPSVVGGDRASIVLDPFGVDGDPEIAYVTSHASGANTATLLRAQAGTLARLHLASTQWVHGPTAGDFTDFQSQLDAQFRTTIADAAGDILAASAADVFARFAVGSSYQALTGDSAATQKMQWRAIPFICTSTTRPATNLFIGMHIFETDTLHTLACTQTSGPPKWEYVGDPPGLIAAYAGSALPDGWVWCDGTTYDGTVARYAALWAVLGTQYGGVSQASFIVPNLIDRFVYGLDPTNPDARGDTGGASQTTLGIQQLPAHDHGAATVAGGSHSHTGTTTANGQHDHSGQTGADGSHKHTLGGGISGSLIQYNHAASTEGLDSASAPGQNVTGATMDNNGDHRHTISDDGSHTHTMTTSTAPTHTHGITSQGSSAAFEIMPPHILLGWAIRL